MVVVYYVKVEDIDIYMTQLAHVVVSPIATCVSAGNATKGAATKHARASRHYHLVTKFADGAGGYPTAKRSWFVARRARVGGAGRAICCRRFSNAKVVRTKAFPRYRHLPNLSVCDSRRSPTSASLLSLFRGNDVKAFETAAIEDDAGIKTASDGALSDRILRKRLATRWNGHLCHV